MAHVRYLVMRLPAAAHSLKLSFEKWKLSHGYIFVTKSKIDLDLVFQVIEPPNAKESMLSNRHIFFRSNTALLDSNFDFSLRLDIQQTLPFPFQGHNRRGDRCNHGCT